MLVWQGGNTGMLCIATCAMALHSSVCAVKVQVPVPVWLQCASHKTCAAALLG